jgi:hypothetical protein
MKAGERFNPSFKACGFYPADVVDHQQWLRATAKVLYRRLIRFAGSKGVCWPSQRTLKFEVGRKSERQIRRDLAELADAKLIEKEQGGRRRSNRYYFLSHPIFDRFDRTNQSAQAAENVRSRPDTSDRMTGQIRSDDRTDQSYEYLRKPSRNRYVNTESVEEHLRTDTRAAIVEPPALAKDDFAAPSLDPNQAIERIIADLAIPTRHLRTVRKFLSGANLESLPKLPRHVAARLAPVASELLGRDIDPADLTLDMEALVSE